MESSKNFGIASSGMMIPYSAGDARVSLINRAACVGSVIGTWMTCHSERSRLCLNGMMPTHFPGLNVDTLKSPAHISVWTPLFPKEKAVTMATSGSFSDPSNVAMRIVDRDKSCFVSIEGTHAASGMWNSLDVIEGEIVWSVIHL